VAVPEVEKAEGPNQTKGDKLMENEEKGSGRKGGGKGQPVGDGNQRKTGMNQNRLTKKRKKGEQSPAQKRKEKEELMTVWTSLLEGGGKSKRKEGKRDLGKVQTTSGEKSKGGKIQKSVKQSHQTKGAQRTQNWWSPKTHKKKSPSESQ